MTEKPAGLTAQGQAFVEWARTVAVPLSIPRRDEDFNDLEFMATMVAGKRIVAVGESAHYLHEWNRWRARLFKYLAEHHGFNVFVLESGLVEGRNVHDYVAGRDVDWETVVASITNAWGVWAELNEMIRWMREWNTDPARERKLAFYCMDGTGNWSHACHAYRAVRAYAAQVDPAFEAQVVSDFEEPVTQAGFENRGNVGRETWHHLIARASLTLSHLEQTRVDYVDASTRDDYEWALRSAQILRDVFVNLSQVELDFSLGFKHFWNVRDVSMTASVQWILAREGPQAKLVVGAHNTHLQQYPVRVQRATSMGTYLAGQRGRDEVLFIGAASAMSVKGDEPRADSNQAAYQQVGPDCFFLDLRAAPASGPVSDWLCTERMDRSNLRYQPVAPGTAWDCIVYHRTLAIGEVELPQSLRVEPTSTDPDKLEALSGRYIILGFLSALNTLDVSVREQTLYTDGHDDASGELFPPYAVPVWMGEDGRFRWRDWPAILTFHDGAETGRVTIEMPGMGIYHGARAELFDDSLGLAW